MKNRYLLQQLIIRDFKQKYKGSILGALWSVIVPLFMMVIYTFVFSEIFHVKWSAESNDKYEYALVIFCGLSSFNMLSEVMTRSITAISGNVNYVKKVIFPLEMLPIAITVTAFVNCLISYGILIVGRLILYRSIYITTLEIVFVVVPLFLTCLGVSYLLSALAVFYKDIANAISIFVTALMYISPVFYSLDAVPSQFKAIAIINPLTYIIENARRVCLYGYNISITYFVCSICIAAIIFAIGELVFKRVKDGFADML